MWDGNEVWLIAAGGTLFFTFPLLYASSFSGFYLPLIIVLWLLMGRGVSIELRSRISNPVWASFWDGIFPLIALVGLPGAGFFNVLKRDTPALLSSGTFILGMLASAAFSLYPIVLPAANHANSLTINNASASAGLLARANEYLVDIDVLWLGDGVDDSVGDILAL